VDAVALLIIEDDPHLSALIALDARQRGADPYIGATIAAAERLMASRAFDVALVDLTLGAESGLEVIRAIKAHSPDTEIVVISASTSLASAIASYELQAFAFVPKPFDIDQLFAIVERALGHRRMTLANRRLLWEQRMINEIGDELRHLVAPDQLVERVLRRLMAGMQVDACAARLLNPDTHEYDHKCVEGPDEMVAIWAQENPTIPRPSDRVLASRAAVSIGDLHEGLPSGVAATIPLRSAISVPMFVAQDLIGVLSLCSLQVRRFSADDQRLLGIIANQVAVALQNARLHAIVRSGKQDWEATFDAIGDPIAVFDRQGRLVRGNAALASCIGRSLTELRGLTCDEIGLCGVAFPDCAIGHAGCTACVHDEVTRHDGQIFSVTTCPVLDLTEGAAIVQIAKNVTRDIQNARRMRQMSDELAAANGRLVATLDRLKSTQAQLLQAEKLSAIGLLVAGVAHELNNPLTSVIGYAQLLQEDLRTNGTQMADNAERGAQLAHDLRRIAEESERAAKIVRNLLAFARRQSAARAPQDIADVVSRVLSLRAYEFRLNAIELETAFEPGLPSVLCDGGQLQQALLNLLLNAEQAMRVSQVRRMRVGARYVRECDGVELSIADTGHGIPGENLRRIFDPFFTTRDVGEGTGLGLSICYGIVRDHGGQIAVQSRVGQGTMFTLLLPAAPGKPSDSLRALVVHRDPTERDYVAAALTGWGHSVIAAESAADAMDRVRGGGLDVALIEKPLMGDAPAWRGVLDAGERTARVIALTEAAGDGGVAPPFELTALHSALRGMVKECV
jgi:signal transduction histidine kinase/DNA-binding response OmpR family regulator